MFRMFLAPPPVGLALRLRLRRPNGQIAAEVTPPRLMGGAISWRLKLSDGAVFGQWSIEALTDPALPPIGRAQFRVDAFVRWPGMIPALGR